MNIPALRSRLRDTRLSPHYRFGTRWTDISAQRRAANALEHGWYRKSDRRAIPLRVPLQWADGNGTPALITETHSWNILDALLQAHHATNNWEYLAKALDVALDWIKQGSSVPGAWSGSAPGHRAHRLGYVIAAAGRNDLAPDDDIATLMVSAADHIALLRPEDTGFSGLISAAGLASISGRLHSAAPDLGMTEDAATKLLIQRFSSQFSEDGILFDRSTTHQREALAALGGIIDSKLLDDPTLQDLRIRGETGLALFVQPDGTLPAIGAAVETYISDIWTARPSSLQTIASSYRSPELLSVASRGWLGTPPASGIHLIRDSGAAIIRTDSGHITFNTSHAQDPHDDDMAITWHEKNTAILIDGGEYEGAPEDSEAKIAARKSWLASPAAHNTVAIEGAASPDSNISKITRWGTVNSMYFLEATASRGEVKHSRSIMTAPGSWLLIRDDLTGGVTENDTYRQHFLAGPQLFAAQNKKSLVLTSRGRPVVFATQLSGSSELTPSRGLDKPGHSGGHAISPNKMAPALSFGWEQRGPGASFVCLFTFEAILDYCTSGATMGWTTRSGETTVTLEESRIVNVKTTLVAH